MKGMSPPAAGRNLLSVRSVLDDRARALPLAGLGLAMLAGAAFPIYRGGPALNVVVESVMVVLACLPAAWAIATGRVAFDRNLPFWMVYGEILIYLYLAPAAYVGAGIPDRDKMAPVYLALQLAVLILFVIPMLLLYIRWNRSEVGLLAARWQFSRRFLAPFVALCLGLPAIYIWLLVQDRLLFRRIGFKGIAEAFVELPRLHFLVIRGFEALAIPLLCVLVLAMRDARGWWRAWLVLGLVSVGAVTLFDASFNSRLQWILTLVLPLAVAVNARPEGARPWRYWVATGLVVIGIVYGLRIVENVRADYIIGQGINVRQFSPTTSVSSAPETPIAFRLNGLDLMARMTPMALTNGYSWGKSWWPSIVVEFGQVFNPALANQYKLAGATEPKWYLMRDYRVASLPDYPSSSLTDLYCNLGPFGLPVAALAYAFLLAVMTRWLRRGSAIQLAPALFLLIDVTYVEGSFIGLALRWVRYAPAVALLIALIPLRRATPTGPDRAPAGRPQSATAGDFTAQQ